MDFSKKLSIYSKILYLNHETDKWWKITKKSRKVTTFITVDVFVVEWLATVGLLVVCQLVRQNSISPDEWEIWC